MAIKVAINGYGRIGRMVVRAIYEERRDDIQVVAINGLGGIDINAHLTQYDSAHGRFPGTVTVDGDHMVINGDRIKIDIKNRTLDLLVDAAELEKRRANFTPLPNRYTYGVLSKYAKLVGSASRGAVCD